MHSSFSKIVKTKPKRDNYNAGKEDKKNSRLRRQRREIKRYGGEE